ncbi:hypothetical protein PM082_000693 [Marasmius tenuissimus]|nr:hypothetical protein PM082_000693 [Marasmius tenuissimus]
MRDALSFFCGAFELSSSPSAEDSSGFQQRLSPPVAQRPADKVGAFLPHAERGNETSLGRMTTWRNALLHLHHGECVCVGLGATSPAAASSYLHQHHPIPTKPPVSLPSLIS